MKTILSVLEKWDTYCDGIGRNSLCTKVFLKEKKKTTEDFIQVINEVRNTINLKSVKIDTRSKFYKEINDFLRIGGYLERWDELPIVKYIILDSFMNGYSPYDNVLLHLLPCNTLQSKLDYIRKPGCLKTLDFNYYNTHSLINKEISEESIKNFNYILDTDSYKKYINTLLSSGKYEFLHEFLRHILNNIMNDNYTSSFLIPDKKLVILFPEEIKSIQNLLANKKILIEELEHKVCNPVSKTKIYLLDTYLPRLLRENITYRTAIDELYQWIKAPVHHLNSIKEYNDIITRHKIPSYVLKPFEPEATTFDIVELSLNF